MSADLAFSLANAAGEHWAGWTDNSGLHLACGRATASYKHLYQHCDEAVAIERLQQLYLRRRDEGYWSAEVPERWKLKLDGRVPRFSPEDTRIWVRFREPVTDSGCFRCVYHRAEEFLTALDLSANSLLRLDKGDDWAQVHFSAQDVGFGADFSIGTFDTEVWQGLSESVQHRVKMSGRSFGGFLSPSGLGVITLHTGDSLAYVVARVMLSELKHQVEYSIDVEDSLGLSVSAGGDSLFEEPPVKMAWFDDANQYERAYSGTVGGRYQANVTAMPGEVFSF